MRKNVRESHEITPSCRNSVALVEKRRDDEATRCDPETDRRHSKPEVERNHKIHDGNYREEGVHKHTPRLQAGACDANDHADQPEPKQPKAMTQIETLPHKPHRCLWRQ